MKTILITGASKGLGAELHRLFWAEPKVWNVVGVDETTDDLRSSEAIDDLCRTIELLELDVLINCAGINRIDYLEDVPLEDWEAIMAVNVRAPFLLAQGLLPQLKRSRGTICNIISNASHVPMTASLAYNASKGALHIMTLQLARELTRRWGITVFGVSPNKMKDTYMSAYIDKRVELVRGWSHEQARKYQLDALLTGEETPPERVAELIHWLLSDRERHRFLSGCVLPYGA